MNTYKHIIICIHTTFSRTKLMLKPDPGEARRAVDSETISSQDGCQRSSQVRKTAVNEFARRLFATEVRNIDS